MESVKELLRQAAAVYAQPVPAAEELMDMSFTERDEAIEKLDDVSLVSVALERGIDTTHLETRESLLLRVKQKLLPGLLVGLTPELLYYTFQFIESWALHQLRCTCQWFYRICTDILRSRRPADHLVRWPLFDERLNWRLLLHNMFRSIWVSTATGGRFEFDCAHLIRGKSGFEIQFKDTRGVYSRLIYNQEFATGRGLYGSCRYLRTYCIQCKTIPTPACIDDRGKTHDIIGITGDHAHVYFVKPTAAVLEHIASYSRA